MPDAELQSFCFYRPVPGELLHTACVECGHVLALHIGVEHCPVCELVHHNERARSALAGSRVRIELSSLDRRTMHNVVERVLREDRMRPRYLR
ncbi:hypothetical protein ACH40F_07820 [Streptomyces sp. NPDC020794]|uniref:hypothetical protein n=1 Tax=unclassified Streptomyces TaxID=2593676 RepID=UPI0036EB240A